MSRSCTLGVLSLLSWLTKMLGSLILWKTCRNSRLNYKMSLKGLNQTTQAIKQLSGMQCSRIIRSIADPSLPLYCQGWDRLKSSFARFFILPHPLKRLFLLLDWMSSSLPELCLLLYIQLLCEQLHWCYCLGSKNIRLRNLEAWGSGTSAPYPMSELWPDRNPISTLDTSGGISRGKAMMLVNTLQRRVSGRQSSPHGAVIASAGRLNRDSWQAGEPVGIC